MTEAVISTGFSQMLTSTPQGPILQFKESMPMIKPAIKITPRKRLNCSHTPLIIIDSVGPHSPSAPSSWASA